MDAQCKNPPRGWVCSRLNNHPGPCAARPTLWTQAKLWFHGVKV